MPDITGSGSGPDRLNKKRYVADLDYLDYDRLASLAEARRASLAGDAEAAESLVYDAWCSHRQIMRARAA